MLPLTVQGISYYLPERQLHASELDKQLGLPIGTIEQKSNLPVRHIVSEHESASYIAARAAEKALKEAHIEAHELDLIISACGVSQQWLPCTAALIQQQLGLESTGIACFDVNSTCLSFITALDIASHFLATHRYKTILIASGDVTSCALNWNHLESSSIFSDGAAACVLTASQGKSGLIAAHLETYSEGVADCCLKAGGTFLPHTKPFEPLDGLFHMDGKKVFKLASMVLDKVHARLMEKANLSMDDINFVIPHQASQLALSHIRKRLNIPEHKFINQFSQFGNQMASSIPTALAVLAQSGRLQRGQLIYLLGTGAGLSAGGIILEY